MDGVISRKISVDLNQKDSLGPWRRHSGYESFYSFIFQPRHI